MLHSYVTDMAARVTPTIQIPYLTLPYLNRDREVKRPLGLKIPLSSSSLTTGQADSYWLEMSYIRLAQCLSSLALNWLIDEAETTDAGREFQSFTTLVLNVFLRVKLAEAHPGAQHGR